MSWTYDSADLTTELNQVRLRIGDTNELDQQLSDEEIQSFIDMSSSVDGAVVLCLRSLAAKYARYTDKWVGNLKVLASQRHRHYLQQLEAATTASGAIGVPSAGGIRRSQKETYEADDDRLGTSIYRDMHDNTEER